MRALQLVRAGPGRSLAARGGSDRALYDEAYFTSGTYAGAAHTGGMDGHLTLYDRPGGRSASLRYQGRLVAQVERFRTSAQGTATRRGLRRGLFLGCSP